MKRYFPRTELMNLVIDGLTINDPDFGKKVVWICNNNLVSACKGILGQEQVENLLNPHPQEKWLGTVKEEIGSWSEQAILNLWREWSEAYVRDHLAELEKKRQEAEQRLRLKELEEAYRVTQAQEILDEINRMKEASKEESEDGDEEL